jgi:hypothetical protein
MTPDPDHDTDLDDGPPEDPAARDAERRRVEERITVISNWLIQGRCGDDSECIEAKTLELRALQARRAKTSG